MDALADAAAAISSISLTDAVELEPAESIGITAHASAPLRAMTDSCEVDKENDQTWQGSQRQRSGADDTMTHRGQPLVQASDANNLAQSTSNHSPAVGAISTECSLTKASLGQRAKELFPEGATEPAAKPQLPAIVESPTNELASLAFDVAKGVKLVRGKLAREQAAGYLAADQLGIELLDTESLRLGEAVRKAALAFKDADAQLRNGASALKSKLRKKAEKDPVTRTNLESEIEKLDTKLATDREKLRWAPIKLPGLPEANTVIVERRVPKPIDQRRRALKRMLGSQEAMDTIDAADACEASERDLLQAKWGYCDEFGDPLDERPIKEELELAWVRYRHALERLKAAFPDELNDCTPEGTCEHRRPCPCGRGRRGAWPWVVQSPARGFCRGDEESLHEYTPRGLYSCRDLHEERERWRFVLAWGAYDARASLMHNGQRRMPEARYHEQLDAICRELY